MNRGKIGRESRFLIELQQQHLWSEHHFFPNSVARDPILYRLSWLAVLRLLQAYYSHGQKTHKRFIRSMHRQEQETHTFPQREKIVIPVDLCRFDVKTHPAYTNSWRGCCCLKRAQGSSFLFRSIQYSTVQYNAGAGAASSILLP
jgi:hypothetical protein